MAAIQDIDFKGKKVLIRVDFNVPLNDKHEITDDTRMVKALPTLQYLLKNGAGLIIMTHMGRPKLDDEKSLEQYSTKHLVAHLTELLEVQVSYLNDCIGEEVQAAVDKLEAGEVILLENTRFHAGEKQGDEHIASELAKLGDIYINDAFGAAHRAHASTSIVAKYFPIESKAFGFLMQAEVENGEKLLKEAEHPVTAIIGGAKVSDKIQLIEKLMDFADNILIGGGMSYTFLKSKGANIGNSLFEEDFVELAAELLKKAEQTNTKIYLPEDSVVADAFSNNANTNIVSSLDIPDNWSGLDIGPKAAATYREVILLSKSLLWNGPVGVFEMSKFATGTLAIAQAIADATKIGAYSLIGGGDSVSAINQSGLADQVSFISTGGGAMLELLEGKTLPGIEAINS